jgi:hypothetical protein
VASATNPHGCILGFLNRMHYYFFQVAPEWTPFETHYFSEKVVALRIEPGHLDL